MILHVVVSFVIFLAFTWLGKYSWDLKGENAQLKNELKKFENAEEIEISIIRDGKLVYFGKSLTAKWLEGAEHDSVSKTTECVKTDK